MPVYKQLKEPSQYAKSFVEGFNHFSHDELEAALPYFSDAVKYCNGDDLQHKNKYLSYYGRTLFQMGDCDKGLKYCLYAANNESLHTDVFYNLAYIAKKNHNRELALKAIAQGKVINPYDTQLIHLRHSLGLRRKPLLGFLSRDNVFNKLLGKVTFMLPVNR